MDPQTLPDLVSLPDGITPDLMREVFGETFDLPDAIAGIGDVHSRHKKGLLSFMASPGLSVPVNANPAIAAVFCRAEDAGGLRADIVPVRVDDPKYYFFTLMDFLVRNRAIRFETEIGSGCCISLRAVISPVNVRIGNGVGIEPGAYVAPGTMIGDGVIIRANATVGVDGFQHQRTSRGMVSPLHDGWLHIGENAEIGTSSSVSRGFSYRPTLIGRDVKMDALCYVAHGTSIGANSIICAHSAIMGHVVIGERAWIGPGAVVSSRLAVGDRAKVSLGAVVTTHVPADMQYSGNFAIPHDVFLKDVKARAAAGTIPASPGSF